MPPKPTTTEHEILSGSDLNQLVQSLDLLAESGWALVGAIQVVWKPDKKIHFYATIRRTI